MFVFYLILLVVLYVKIVFIKREFLFLKEWKHSKYLQYGLPLLPSGLWAINDHLYESDLLMGIGAVILKLVLWFWVFTLLKFMFDRANIFNYSEKIFTLPPVVLTLMDLGGRGFNFLPTMGVTFLGVLIIFLTIIPFKRYPHEKGALYKVRNIFNMFLWLMGFTLISSFSFVHYRSVSEWVLSIIGVLAILWTSSVVELLLSSILKNRRKVISFALFILFAVATGVSFYRGLSIPQIREIEVPLSAEGKEWDGYTIILMTDLHIKEGRLTEWFGKAFKVVEDEAPDMVLLGGDILEQRFSENSKCFELLKSIKPKDGVYAITGNHEYYHGVENLADFLEKANINVLRNSSVKLENGLRIVGIDDRESFRFGYNSGRLKKAFRGVKPEEPVVFLNHRPMKSEEAISYGSDLQLSGHTHLGQIPPMDLLVYIYYKYPYGLYSIGKSWIYTSSGAGFWGMPMRLFSGNEIVKIRLKKRKLLKENL